jgi:hypothetical protein
VTTNSEGVCLVQGNQYKFQESFQCFSAVEKKIVPYMGRKFIESSPEMCSQVGYMVEYPLLTEHLYRKYESEVVMIKEQKLLAASKSVSGSRADYSIFTKAVAGFTVHQSRKSQKKSTCGVMS